MTPRSTYRLQFHAGFTFRDATAIVPYLASLGISHIYASPYLKARAGSIHGYDIVDHNHLNPELGDEHDYRAFVDALRAHGMGHIVDFVPNHMGVGGDDNPWWLDLLSWGEDSHYSDYFDVDWEPARSELRGKVLLPFLGAQYGEVLDAGDLTWEYIDGAFGLRYFEHCFPLTPPSYPLLLVEAEHESLRSFAPLFASLETMPEHVARRAAAAKLRGLMAVGETDTARAFVEKLNAERTTAAGKALLDRLVEAQRWRPASWRVAAEEINYRRFFDVNGLAAIRMENANTFGDAHRLLFALLENGDIDGIRLDHVDGLYDPIGYCELLRSRADVLGQPMYLVVEKILAPGQELLSRWHVDGTTGYEFMNAVVGIQVDRSAERAFDRIYRRMTGDEETFAEQAYRGKRLVLETSLSAERNVLALRLDRLAQRDPHTRDFTLGALRRALTETIASFSIYRTYVTGAAIEAPDRLFINRAIAAAQARDLDGESTVYDFLRRVLLTEHDDEGTRSEYVEFAMRFQQLTSPVTAKGVEDTAFYRSLRLAALNEVGGDPGHFGLSLREFHRQNARRAADRPLGMLATATHDMKRGEDVRARLSVLSEVPMEWSRAVSAWSRLNRSVRGEVTRLDEYHIYQTLLGAWPVELFGETLDPDALTVFADRISAYIIKACREAKLHTSWTNPSASYEGALDAFVRALLDPQRRTPFVHRIARSARTLALNGLVNTLAQTVLRATSPGVPDTYQGCELWDLSLVDPDNRRPIDYTARIASLRAIDDALAAGAPRDRLAAELLASWHDGRIKQYLLATLLRADAAAAFADAYAPLDAVGEQAERVIAFARGDVITVVPRMPRSLKEDGLPVGQVWGSTALPLGTEAPSAFVDILTGLSVPIALRDGRPVLELATVFAVLPVAVLRAA